MEKLQQLNDYLLDEVPGLANNAESLHVYAEQGKTISYTGNENQNFKLEYKAVILFENTRLSVAQLSYILLQFLAIYQPTQNNNEPLSWNAEIINRGQVDLMVSLDLCETIKANDVEGQIALISANEFEHDLPLPGRVELEVEHQPAGPPDNV